MLANMTAEKLREMNLGTMAAKFKEQLVTPEMAELSFEDRFGLLVDSEWATRKNNRLARLIRMAGYPYPNACLEDVEYHADRHLDKALITRLGTCAYVQEHYDVIILGATGCGKSYMASALGMMASRNFLTVKYVRLPELLSDLAIAHAEGNCRKVLKAYRQVNLLILDDWLMYPIKENEARDLLEITEGRYKKGSTIFCSQLAIAGWHQNLGGSTLADAVCDRIIHDAHTIVIGGDDSMRKRKGLKDEG